MYNPNDKSLLELIEHAIENDRMFHWISGRDPTNCRDSSCPLATGVIRLYRKDIEWILKLLKLQE